MHKQRDFQLEISSLILNFQDVLLLWLLLSLTHLTELISEPLFPGLSLTCYTNLNKAILYSDSASEALAQRLEE